MPHGSVPECFFSPVKLKVKIPSFFQLEMILTIEILCRLAEDSQNMALYGGTSQQYDQSQYHPGLLLNLTG